MAGHLGEIDLVDENARQGFRIEFDRPAAVAGGANLDIRDDRIRAAADESQARSRIERSPVSKLMPWAPARLNLMPL